MLPKLHRKKGGKNRRVLNIVAIVSGILFSCLVLFLALDSFTLYWFTLLNKDSALEARRNEDFEWYDSFAGGATGTSPTGKPAPGYNSNFSGSGCEYAMSEVVKTLTLEEMQTKETAMRFFIYLMDCNGYTPNAIVGAMSYMYQEGAALGTFTYESYKYCTGPSGVYKDFTLDNNAWLSWLDGDGLRQAIVLYKNMRDGGKSVGYAAIGLGLTQESDTWSSDGSKGTHRATDLINFANSKGGYWQYPNIQMLYYEQKFQGDVAWDLNDCPGPDPKSSTEITATEWAGRVLCGIGMPGWSYTNCLDSVNYPNSYASLQSHIAGVPAAQELYNKYSGKDPWFYNADGSQIYAPQGGNGTLFAGSYIWGENACPACGKVKSNDWHCPFCGPTYDNSTSQGLLLARVALLNLIGYRTNGWVFPSGGALGFTSAAKADARCNNYRITIANFGRTAGHAADCCSAVQAMVRLSGVDVNMPKYGTLQMESYLYGKGEDVYNNGTYHCAKNNGAWEYVGLAGSVQLQPGDILIYNTDYPNAGGSGHIQMYVGANVAQERWPETNSVLAQASQEQYYWDLSSKANIDGSYRVFRCTSQCPYNNLTNWNTWKSEYYDNFGRNYSN